MKEAAPEDERQGLEEIQAGQPFRLRLLRKLLEEAGAGDFEFLREAETGLPLGVKHQLPRAPNSFEKQTKWNLQNDPSVEGALMKDNYSSAKEHKEHVKRHLEDEVREGLVVKMREEDFIEKYGKERAVAALAVLVEDEVTGKKRIIHDGSHEILVNHRIRSKDKLRMPGGREKRALLGQFKSRRETVFSLIGDFGKAHRRFKYREDEWGYLGCKAEGEDGYVYVNCVGTFGIASTPYWWGRLSGALVRVCHYLLGPEYLVELLLYADDSEGMGPGPAGRKGL